MTKEELAKQLDGRKRYSATPVITDDDFWDATCNDLVVIYGSPELHFLVKIDGAITETLLTVMDDIFYYDCDEQRFKDVLDSFEEEDWSKYPNFKIELTEESANSISTTRFITNIPHATFDLYDGESVYCVGLVINANDLKND